MQRSIGKTLLLVTIAATANIALAQAEDAVPSRQYVLDLGAGVMAKPKYPGADEYIAVPFPIIAVGRFFVPGVGQVVDGSEAESRFNLYPSFDFHGERQASDSSDLKGTKDIDWALEAGLGASYRYDWLRGFVALRQGFNGHTGQVADFGVDFVMSPAEDWQLTVGPRATWGSEDYMQTYFGVSASEAAAPGSSLSEYDIGAGFQSVGISARASYDLTESTTLHIQGGWERLIGDAADSPIVEEGDANQFSIGAGLSYEFAFDVFD